MCFGNFTKCHFLKYILQDYNFTVRGKPACFYPFTYLLTNLLKLRWCIHWASQQNTIESVGNCETQGLNLVCFQNRDITDYNYRHSVSHIFKALNPVCTTKLRFTTHIFAWHSSKFNRNIFKLFDANGDCFGFWHGVTGSVGDAYCIPCSQAINCSQRGIIAVKCHFQCVLCHFLHSGVTYKVEMSTILGVRVFCIAAFTWC